jgi:hypothetical protein
MKNILTIEAYLQKQYESFQEHLTNNEENFTELNEGLLTNLFGALLKKDMWSIVKGENSIKKEFRDIDEKLNGFYLTKIKNPNTSQNVRQILVDWATDIYNAKIKVKEESEKKNEDDKDKQISLEDVLNMFSGESEEKIKKGGVTDETLKSFSKLYSDGLDMKSRIKKKPELENMIKEVEKVDKKYQKLLDDVTIGSSDLKRWANLLKVGMESIIDKLLCGKYDEENKLAKDLEEVQKKDGESLKKKNEEEQKKENEQLKKLNNERNSVLKKCGAELTSEKSGTGFVKKVIEACKTNELFEEKSVFDDKTKVNLDIYKNSGLEKLLGINVEKDNTSLFDTLFTLNDVVISNLENDFKKTLNDISGTSMQAFFVAYCNLILACHTKNEKLDDNLKTCMARCSVLNNSMIGFGLPCPDELDSKKDEEKVSMFVYYLDKTIKSWKDGSNTSDKNSTDGNGGMRTKRLEQFRKEIQDKTKKLVEDYEKQQKQELNKEEQEQKKEEGK